MISKAIIFLSISFMLVVTAYCQTAKELSDAAVQLYQQENYEEAIALLHKSIVLEPVANSYFGLGLCYTRLGVLDKADQAFERAVTEDPSYVDGYLLLAEIYSDPTSKYFDRNAAETVLVKSVAIDFYNPRSQLLLGRIYFSKGTIGINTTREEMLAYQKRAEKTLLQVLELNPGVAEAHLLLGQLYGTWGQRNSAVIQFQKAVAIDPDLHEAWYDLGRDYTALGLIDEARKALQKALQSQKTHIRNAAAKLLEKLSLIEKGE